ncbi:CPBP family intramembrane metalloprotease [Luteolibacter ambystomatis]|uniref:CPBP family intramembrane metalloprotease n=1 Tax=Luteolibacter ambystomatis TaxID=2824561 RepID=A0A975IYX2_9BACT|nr:type II CAAX endopeptidase family protein [Luteolibacter ambystomatis]QUE50579.1 CPBP family intramembrane metalloprotease [Luteolibacter ambystomatis]
MSDLLALAAANPIPVQIVKGSFLAAMGVAAIGAGIHALLRRDLPGEEPIVVIEPPAITPPPFPVEPTANPSPYSPPAGMSPEAVAAMTRPGEDLHRIASPGVTTRWYHRVDLIVAGFLFLFFFFQAVATASMPPGSEVKYTPEALIGAMVFQFGLAGIVIAVMFGRVRPAPWLGLRWPKWPAALLIGPGCVLLMWALMFALDRAGYMKWSESLGGGAQDTVKLLKESKDPVILGLMALIAVVVAPLCEEIIFRGYLYPVAKRFAGAWPAAIFSALVFGAAHGNLTALLPLFLLALLLVWLYEKTGSLWSTIAVHFCFNGATVLIQFIVRYYNIPVDPGM